MTFDAQEVEPGCDRHTDAAMATLVALSQRFRRKRRISRRPPTEARRGGTRSGGALGGAPFRSRNGRRCAARSTTTQECHTSRKRLAATGQPIAQLLIIERGDKKLLQIAVPPVALIQPGVQVKIDNGEATGVKYVVCTPGECLALGEINADFIGKLKKGGNITVTMLNPQGKPVNFDISLVGFTAIYDGPGIDPEEAQARQQKLEDELKKKADEARQQLLQLQQQQSSSTTQ